ncbi:hypothetical protein ACMA5I_03135 [Paracoccaceae bacterium GXU_MW_L88]
MIKKSLAVIALLATPLLAAPVMAQDLPRGEYRDTDPARDMRVKFGPSQDFAIDVKAQQCAGEGKGKFHRVRPGALRAVLMTPDQPNSPTCELHITENAGRYTITQGNGDCSYYNKSCYFFGTVER